MSEFNYGISCSNASDAEKLFQYIGGLDIYQDGLDIDDERVSVVSTQSLLKEIENFAKKSSAGMTIEVWDSATEYDDAEADGTLETYEISGKPKTNKGSPKPSKYATYSGQQENIKKFKKWLLDLKLEGFNLIEEWEPEEEFGSYGVEFTCNDPDFAKLAKKEWMSKGVITEKKKN